MHMDNVFFLIQELFSWVGVAVITAGGARAIIILVMTLTMKKRARCIYYHARMALCQAIVFGLEFMIAADVVKTMIIPDQKNIILLGGLVIIRTVLSYALSYELVQLTKDHKEASCPLKN